MAKKLDPSKLILGTKKDILKEDSQFIADNKIETAIRKIHKESSGEVRDNSENETTKRTTLDIPMPLHKKISHRALDKDLTLKDYFLGLAIKDLSN